MDIDTEARFTALWHSLASIGRDEATGGYLRYTWSEAELACREWFVEEALDRELAVESDGNGNIWAWWGDPTAPGAVVTGSHFDSVPHGGAYDGPLGIVSALLAVDDLRARRVKPVHPIAIVAFAEEEGARFGLACLGSRLLTGAVNPQRAANATDQRGITFAEAAEVAEAELALGPRPEQLQRIGAFVELHIEQGRALAELDAPVGVASGIWPHGRWRLEVGGEANHAGTTRMSDRHDPMLTFAFTVLAANKEARLRGAHATIARVAAQPNVTNAVAQGVTGWLDARAADQATLDEMIGAIATKAKERADRDGTTISLNAESSTPGVEFDAGLRERIVTVLGGAPTLPTAAGHDAGVLAAAGVPAGMLFVRNPTGVSHAPAEHATEADCAAGVAALTAVLEELACQ